MGGRGASSVYSRKTVSERELATTNAIIKRISAKVDKINSKAEKTHGKISEKEMQEGMKLYKTLTELTQKRKNLEKKIAVEKETKRFLEFAKSKRSRR